MIEVLRPDGRPPWRIGHKGAAALAPENTLAAFEAAVAHGVDLVELDVLGLQDGTLVVAHSDDLREVSHGAAEGGVGEKSLAELRRLAPELPTFDEALEFFARQATGTGIHLDLKSVDREPVVVEAVRRHGLVDRTLVTSFTPSSLQAIGRLEPGLRLGLSYPHDRRGLSRHRALAPGVAVAVLGLRATLPRRIDAMLDRTGATVASLHHLVVSRAAVERCHARGTAVFAWTVDSPKTVDRLAGLGVDAIITNDPRILATS